LVGIYIHISSNLDVKALTIDEDTYFVEDWEDLKGPAFSVLRIRGSGDNTSTLWLDLH
jgi:hypothetical protein